MTNISAQIIYGADGKPLFAVLPYAAYLDLQNQLGSTVTFEDEAQRFVRLPHGGPKGQLDVVKLVEFFVRENLLEMPVNQRAQVYAKFPPDQHVTLDPWIRREILGLQSPYANTMQATNAVVSALVSTGLFDRSRMEHQAFFRSVNSIKLNLEKVPAFLARFASPAKDEKIPFPERAAA